MGEFYRVRVWGVNWESSVNVGIKKHYEEETEEVEEGGVSKRPLRIDKSC